DAVRRSPVTWFGLDAQSEPVYSSHAHFLSLTEWGVAHYPPVLSAHPRPSLPLESLQCLPACAEDILTTADDRAPARLERKIHRENHQRRAHQPKSHGKRHRHCVLAARVGIDQDHRAEYQSDRPADPERAKTGHEGFCD